MHTCTMQEEKGRQIISGLPNNPNSNIIKPNIILKIPVFSRDMRKYLAPGRQPVVQEGDSEVERMRMSS